MVSVASPLYGSRIVSGSADHTLRIWDTVTGEQEAQLEDHTSLVLSVAFSHQGDFVVFGSQDGTIRVWNTTTYETELLLTGHPYEMESSDDKYVVVSSSDRVVSNMGHCNRKALL
jgi:WD40 repeat protein